MHKILLLLILLGFTPFLASSQCTTTNATSCACRDGSTDCDLLPDIGIGVPPLQSTGTYGVIEYAQTGSPNPADNGRLKITVSTPNPGYGPLELRATSVFVCGTDTFYGTPPTLCPDGFSYPKIQIDQRIYHKNGSVMTWYDRPAGTMTYHPTHGHMHVDDWGVFTLRIQNPNDPNPLHWDIVGRGAKLAFCVEDYGQCSDAQWLNNCTDSLGNPLNSNASFPNYMLGGGNYSCSSSIQGITSGMLDAYWTSLNGMWIDIPPGTCNGQYYMVVEVDPNNNFVEEVESNNVLAVPYTLALQEIPANQPPRISISPEVTTICSGSSIALSAAAGTSYLWSTGDTTRAISVTQNGNYSCSVVNSCGTATSTVINISTILPPSVPVASDDTIAVPGTALLTATGTALLRWYDQPTGGTLLGTGSPFTTPFIGNTTTFYVEDVNHTPGVAYASGLPNDSLYTGAYSATEQSLVFDVYKTIVLQSVKVYADSAGPRSIELLSDNGMTLATTTVQVVPGLNIVPVNFTIQPGHAYRLTRHLLNGSGRLYRNNAPNGSGVYPITVPGVMSITGNTTGGSSSNYYYFFYDWQIHELDIDCSSPRVPAVAVVTTPVGIGALPELSSFSLFPNPAHQSVSVLFEIPGVEKADLEFLNTMGQRLFRTELYSANGKFSGTYGLGALSKGIYVIRLSSGEKNYYRKLIVE